MLEKPLCLSRGGCLVLQLSLNATSVVGRGTGKQVVPRSFGPRPRSFTFCGRSLLPAHSRTYTQAGHPRRLM